MKDFIESSSSELSENVFHIERNGNNLQFGVGSEKYRKTSFNHTWMKLQS